MNQGTQDKRSQWKTQMGFLIAAIGSAIGLGNIWRFSYMAHQYGGSAFLLPYIVALLVAGIPIIILEYGVGHREKGAPALAFAKIDPKWEWVGWLMPLIAMFGIMLYYSVVIGWCVNYLFYSFDLKWGIDTQDFFFNKFLQLSDSPTHLGGIRIPIMTSTLFVWFICWVICFRDVSHGIEKACFIFMPLLFILTIILCVWSLTLDGAVDAVWNHYFKWDFEKIFNSSEVWVAAFSQIFFTLSLGFGIMITYASYLPEKTDMTRNAYVTALFNCGYSVLIAGPAVFATIGFMAKTQGVPFSDVIKSGPQLAFVVYPKAISLLPACQEIFGFMFFLVLVIAGISSGISLIEAFACSLTDKFSWARKKTVSIICLSGFLGSLIFTTRAGLLILDIVDYFITNYALIFGGILECLIVGWYLKSENLRKHIQKSSLKPYSNLKNRILCFITDYLIRFITPLILIYILFRTLKFNLTENYGNYSTDALFLYGVLWLLIALIISVIFTFYPWKPEKLKRAHEPGEDELFI